MVQLTEIESNLVVLILKYQNITPDYSKLSEITRVNHKTLATRWFRFRQKYLEDESDEDENEGPKEGTIKEDPQGTKASGRGTGKRGRPKKGKKETTEEAGVEGPTGEKVSGKKTGRGRGRPKKATVKQEPTAEPALPIVDEKHARTTSPDTSDQQEQEQGQEQDSGYEE